MPHNLVTAILFDRSLALEQEESALAPNHDRARLETILLASYQKRTEASPAQWLMVLGLCDPSIPLSPSLAFWRDFAASWVRQVQTQPDMEAARDRPDLTPHPEESFAARMPPMVGIDAADAAFLDAQWSNLLKTFQHEIRAHAGTVGEYFAALAPAPRRVDRIHFHLVENRRDDARPFAFLATYSTRIDEQGRTRHLPLKHAFEEFSGRNEKLLELLATVNKVAKKSRLIASMVDSGEIFRPIGLTPPEAMSFLQSVADFEAAGILCRIPRWWKGAPAQAAVTLSVGHAAPSRVGFDALLDFDAGLHIGGEPVSEAEARRILERAEGLALIKGKWAAVDVDSLARALDTLKQARKLAGSESISFADAMRMLMGMEPRQTASTFSGAGITCGQWLKSVLEKLADPTLVRDTPPSSLLKAHLRPYQKQGFNWLCFMQSLGFGICLADDMGLGKTVQMLAHLQKIKKAGQTSLIVVPASLIENWRAEINKFTPDLRAVVIHPQIAGDIDYDDIQGRIGAFDVAITSYGMLSRCAWLAGHTWFYVICDEAQAIKNPATKQTRAVKALTARHRCVMTGTPVENRLSDLWSLFDFINPGLLGTFNEFRNFSKRLNDHPEGFGRLRRVVRPYILRRSKTDKSVISDLPDKIEMKTWCGLQKNQAVIYGHVVAKLEKDLAMAEGIRRKGLVLTCLMKCKQICNHPDHYSGSGAFDPAESGKFGRLAQLCETIREKRERVLVFTQFAEIIGPLSLFLEGVFGRPGLALSGSTSVKNRTAAVERFQGDDYVPFFILSLKAGGVGLNLTAANHVVHFDRWWNPAVENQATDRAFRIGQKKNVMVHKFICAGTVEEKIDALMEDKRKLAGEILQAGAENWITELDDNAIKEMFSLTLGAGGND